MPISEPKTTTSRVKDYVTNFFTSSQTSLDIDRSGRRKGRGEHAQVIDMSDAEAVPLTPRTSVLISSNKSLYDEVKPKGASVYSLPTLMEKDFTLIKTKPHYKQSQEVLLEGPRRIIRLCIFVLICPVILISIPIYARMVLYPPGSYPMAPTDQRILGRPISSFWCQGQSVKMNGSFNAYLLHNQPKYEKKFRNYTMLHHLTLEDDVKEYWGFYFTAGSTIFLSSCTRYDGGQLMILRGVNNLKKCAWVGENDSSEEIIDIPINANITSSNFTSAPISPHGITEGAPIEVTPNESMQTDEDKDYVLTPDTSTLGKDDDFSSVTSYSLTSKERQLELDRIIAKAIFLSKNKAEILNRLHRQNANLSAKEGYMDKVNMSSLNITHKQQLLNSSQLNSDYIQNEDKDISFSPSTNYKKNSIDNSNRSKRSLDDDDYIYDDAHEDIDDLETVPIVLDKNKENMTLENQIGEWMIPKGLRYDQGIFNQSTNGDASFEEFQSSFSSSEEALASCKGVLLSLPLVSDRNCLNFENTNRNKISYQIPVSGTYYFVFSSDNEVFINDVYFNLTMQKQVYDIQDAHDSCINQTDCSLPLKFLTEDHAVVEVLRDGKQWTDSYLMQTECEPRVIIYIFILLLVPIFILFCALR